MPRARVISCVRVLSSSWPSFRNVNYKKKPNMKPQYGLLA